MKIITLNLFPRTIIIIVCITTFLLPILNAYGYTPNSRDYHSNNDISYVKEKNLSKINLSSKHWSGEVLKLANDHNDITIDSLTLTKKHNDRKLTLETTKRANTLDITVIKIQDVTAAVSYSNGIFEAIASGVTPEYTYQWSTSTQNQTTASATGLTNQTHNVTLTEASGTQRKKSAGILYINNCNIKATPEVTNVLCTGETTGIIDLSISNGTPPYIFTWSNGLSTEDLTNVAAGTYSVTISDANNCTIIESFTITEPVNPLTLSVTSKLNSLCNEPGQLNVCGRGGTSPYSYSIDDGVTYQTSGIFRDLIPGHYNVTVRDANECQTVRCVQITTNCTNAITDINNTFIDTPVSGNVLTNDEDLEGDTQTVTTTTVTTSQGVDVIIVPDTGMYTYTPPLGFIGEDTFEYTICDDGSPIACDSATVYIEVLPKQNPENNPPIANPDTANTEIDTPVSGNVLANDFDPDQDIISVTTTSVLTSEGVSVIIDSNTGTFIYIPPVGFIGEDTFEYTICDNGTPILCDTAIVVITVFENQDNSTFANDDAYFVSECENRSGNILDNDFDPEGDTQLVNATPINGVDNGTLVLNTDGTFIYTPNSQFVGTDSFIYSICDTGNPSACDQATVYFIVSDETPPDITNCNVVNETIECNGTDNKSIADTWNSNNILELESCIANACGTDFNGTIISDYDFGNLVSSCGLGGIIEVTYTITDENDNSTTLMATLTLADTTPPSLDNCTLDDMTLECSVLNAEEIANQWNVDNIILLETCAIDECSSNTLATVSSNYNFTTINDGMLIVEYIVTDECGNSSSITAKLTLENRAVAANDVSLCIASDIESQIFDLFDLLDGEINFDGTWEVVSGNATVIDNQFFDPLSIELFGENASETITFSYTEDNSGCPIYVEAEIEIHNRCAVFACGDEDIKISKVITPNGDPFNEYFVVDGVEDCNYIIDVKILNRWGAIVYQSDNYQNDWNGTSPRASLGSANQVPTGTYYYIVTLNNSGLKPFSEPLYIGTK